MGWVTFPRHSKEYRLISIWISMGSLWDWKFHLNWLLLPLADLIKSLRNSWFWHGNWNAERKKWVLIMAWGHSWNQIDLIYKPGYSRSVAIVVTSYVQDNHFMAVTQKLVTLAGEFTLMRMMSSPLAEGYCNSSAKKLNSKHQWLNPSWVPVWLIMMIGTLIILWVWVLDEK